MGKTKGKAAAAAAARDKPTMTVAATASTSIPSTVGVWNEELVAAEASRQREAIKAEAQAAGGSAKDIRRRRLELTIKDAEGRRKTKTQSVLNEIRGKETKKAGVDHSAFADLLSALPDLPKISSGGDPFAPVLNRIQPNNRSLKKTRTKIDIGAIAQFSALVGVKEFQQKPLKAMAKHFRASEDTRAGDAAPAAT